MKKKITIQETYRDIMKGLSAFQVFPEMPDQPKEGKWYRVSLTDCRCGDGSPYSISFRLGREDKLMINFHGGGVAYDIYTLQRPIASTNTDTEGFYFNEISPMYDAASCSGIGSQKEECLFKDWTMININYTSGDFHTGTNRVDYTGLDGKEQTAYLHGYTNFQAAMEKLMPYLGSPETLILCGESAGAFGVAALAEDVIEMFPECGNITVCPDSGLLVYDGWQKTAAELWGSPAHIVEKLTDTNFVTGCMLDLHRKYGDRIQYMYTSSLRDGSLAEYQEFMDGRPKAHTREGGLRHETHLAHMYRQLKAAIPEMGFYLHDSLPHSEQTKELDLTIHTLLMNDRVLEPMEEGISIQEWLWNASEGKVETILCEKMRTILEREE